MNIGNTTQILCARSPIKSIIITLRYIYVNIVEIFIVKVERILFPCL